LLISRIPASVLRAAFGWFVVAMAFFILAQEIPSLLGHERSLPLAMVVSAVGTITFAVMRRVAQGLRNRRVLGSRKGHHRLKPPRNVLQLQARRQP
jgi:hypothetical protein